MPGGLDTVPVIDTAVSPKSGDLSVGAALRAAGQEGRPLGSDLASPARGDVPVQWASSCSCRRSGRAIRSAAPPALACHKPGPWPASSGARTTGAPGGGDVVHVGPMLGRRTAVQPRRLHRRRLRRDPRARIAFGIAALGFGALIGRRLDGPGDRDDASPRAVRLFVRVHRSRMPTLGQTFILATLSLVAMVAPFVLGRPRYAAVARLGLLAAMALPPASATESWSSSPPCCR